MARVYQLGFLVAILLASCQAESQGRPDCRLYPYAPMCRGIMTRKNFHGGEYPIDPAGFPDAGMWGAAGGPVGRRVVQGGLAARAYTPETDSADDADPSGGAEGMPDFWHPPGNWGAPPGSPIWDEIWLAAGAAGAGKQDFPDDEWSGIATGKPDFPDDKWSGGAGEPIGRRVVKGGIRPRATDKFL